MAENSKIEWCDHTFNPWIGCTKISPGCANCYAEVSTPSRTMGVEWGKGNPRHRTSELNWNKPLAWNRKAEKEGVRHRVFCASLADWLDPEVPIEWLADLLDLIRQTPNLDWLLLTKRPELWNMRLDESFGTMPMHGIKSALANFVGRWLFDKNPPSNVWIGTTVENQKYADLRIPDLLKIPAKVHFLSCEPLLGKLDLRKAFDGDQAFPLGMGIQWVICGGESGRGARPMHPDWARSLRDQCQAAGVPFFFKQWGEWGLPDDVSCVDEVPERVYRIGSAFPDVHMYRIGKKAAGRLLDGREWNELPNTVNKDG